MDKIDEIKELKKLLDEGLIAQDDFINQKRKILQIEDMEQDDKQLKDQAIIDETEEKITKTIEDYEKELTEMANEEGNKEEYYEMEKIKEKARLDAKEELRRKKIEERGKVIQKGTVKLKVVLKWALAMFLILMSMGSFLSMSRDVIAYLICGIIFALLGIMACPAITKITVKYEKYTKYKKSIAIIMTIILFVFIAIAGAGVQGSV